MKFSTREDIEAPQDFVFAELTDFAAFERAAMRRGAEVRRVETAAGPGGPGLAWNIAFRWRGKPRRLISELTGFEPSNLLRFHGAAGGYDLDLMFDLIALARGRTRLGVELEVRPKTLPARLTIQSMRLAKGNLARRYAMQVKTLARDIEARSRKAG